MDSSYFVKAFISNGDLQRSSKSYTCNYYQISRTQTKCSLIHMDKYFHIFIISNYSKHVNYRSVSTVHRDITEFHTINSITVPSELQSRKSEQSWAEFPTPKIHQLHKHNPGCTVKSI